MCSKPPNVPSKLHYLKRSCFLAPGLHLHQTATQRPHRYPYYYYTYSTIGHHMCPPIVQPTHARCPPSFERPAWKVVWHVLAGREYG